jgi:hypothetical protein
MEENEIETTMKSYACGNERIETHDVTFLQSLCKMLVSTCDESNLQLHSIPPINKLTFVFTKNKNSHLSYVVIVDPTHAYLLLRSYTTQRFTTSNVAQAKKKELPQPTPHQSIFPSNN